MEKVHKKSGFTLTELIAILVILSIIISLSTIVFLNVRKNILQKEYENLVFYLESKAVEYANDTNIITVSVEDLIIEGYVKPDDETDIYDPRNNKSMNCNIIESEFVDGNFEAKLSYDSVRNSQGKCQKYTKTSYMSICKLDKGACIDIDKNSWFNSDLTLGIKHKNELVKAGEDVSFSWSTNTGFTSTDASVKTNVNVGEVTYTCEVTYGELIGNAVQLIKIDKEKPKITDVTVDENWSQSKDVVVSANDGYGSGISGYAITTNEGTCTDYQSSNKLTVNASGSYKVCVKDKAGNAAEQSNIKVANIDNTAPTITAKQSENSIYVGDDYEVLSTYFTVTYSSSGGATTCNYEKTGKLSSGTYTLKCTAVGGTGLSASATTSLIVKPITPATPSVVTKYSNASGGTYSGSWTNKNVYFDISSGKTGDVITHYEYKVGSGSWTKISGDFTYSNEIGGSIEVRACNENSCSSSVSKPVKIDKTAPKITAKSSSNSISVGTNYTVLSTYFTITYSKSGGTSTCNYEKTGSLSIGTYTLKCTAVGGTGLTASATTSLTVTALTPSTPSVTTRYSSSSGSTYNGSWTNKNVYFDISPGKSSDVVTKYEYRVGSGSWQTTYGDFTYSNENDTTIQVRACNGNNCSSSVSKTVRIDKTAPTCSLSVTANRVSINYKSSDVEDFGVNRSSSASYSSSYQTTTTGTFYGHVYDKAGNTGKCSVYVTNATPTYRKTTTTCNRTVSSYDCKGSATSKKTCPSGYTADTYNCYKRTSATLKTSYTKTYKTCTKSTSTDNSGTVITCTALTTSKCTNYKCKIMTKAGKKYCVGNPNNIYCANSSYTYNKSTGKCTKTTTTYKWGTTNTATVNSCTNNNIDCNQRNYNKQYVSCKNNSYYYCSSGTLKSSYCYLYSAYNTTYVCSKGTKSGNNCYLYKQSYCPSGFSNYNTNYTYSTSDSTTTVNSCSTESSKSCNSSNVGKSYVSKCTINAYKCSSGYSMAGTYCYR